MPGAAILAEPEYLPFAPHSFDLIVAPLCLHWVNDLPGALLQLRRALRPDGLFLASLPVLGTLATLRDALAAAELALTGQVTPRVSPFPTLRDCAALLQRAGFASPVADVQDITLLYRNPMKLLADLRAAGETNAVAARSRAIPPRSLFAQALASLPAENERVSAAARLGILTGWGSAPGEPA
jgi:SAM-dependent methyltransferase